MLITKKISFIHTSTITLRFYSSTKENSAYFIFFVLFFLGLLFTSIYFFHGYANRPAG